MRAVLKIEDIRKHNMPQNSKLSPKQKKIYKRRAWIAKIKIGNGIEREFLKPAKNCANANGTGSRGVYIYFWLENGIYEVSEPTSWSKEDRYFCLVHEGKIKKLSFEEMVEYFRGLENA